MPVDCPECELECRDEGKLAIHMRTHTGDKPYECDTCDKSFARQNTLDRHKLTHTGAKPYKCIFCKRCFLYQFDLDRHLSQEECVDLIRCSQCAMVFESKELYICKYRKSLSVIRINFQERRCSSCVRALPEKDSESCLGDLIHRTME